MSNKVLVVIEHRETGVLIAERLQEQGHEVTLPVDSYVALEFSQENPYDLIIFDDQMPLLAGEDFIRTLREKKVQSPVILIAETQNPPNRAQLETLSVKAFMSKPVQADSLMQTISRVMDTP